MKALHRLLWGVGDGLEWLRDGACMGVCLAALALVAWAAFR